MVRALFEDEVSAFAGGEDVLVEVDEVDGAPDAVGGVGGFFLSQVGEAVEERVRILEDGFAELEEAGDEPVFDVGFVGVDVDRAVEEV